MAVPPQRANWTIEEAAHLLNRGGFGGTPGEIYNFHNLGRNGAIQSLLNGDEDSDLFPMPSLMTPVENHEVRVQIKQITDGNARLAAGREAQAAQHEEAAVLRDWWLNRMRYTPFPLREKMTLFWHGHFATSFEKVKNSFALAQQNETFRAHALGNFRELTGQISRDPAMMQYLDLNLSDRRHPNENFAREVMELFLLGEGVCYTEKDIQESARAFTGYRINYHTGQFRFDLAAFDDTTKHFMGHTGKFNGDDILDIIFQQPECSEFIVRKVWAFLAGVPVSKQTQSQLASDFRVSGFDLSTLLQAIFLSSEFYSPAVMRNQIKSPVQWLVQLSRELEVPLPPARLAQLSLTQMGQTLLQPPNVKGWEGGRSWINSTTFLTRCNLAGILVAGSHKFRPLPVPWERLAPSMIRQSPDALCAQLSFRLFNTTLPRDDQAKFVDFLQKRGSVVDDDSLREVVHLMMSSPQYQLT